MISYESIELENIKISESDLYELTSHVSIYKLVDYYISYKFHNFLIEHENIQISRTINSILNDTKDFIYNILKYYSLRSDSRILVSNVLKKFEINIQDIDLYYNRFNAEPEQLGLVIFVIHLHFDEIIDAIIKNNSPYDIKIYDSSRDLNLKNKYNIGNLDAYLPGNYNITQYVIPVNYDVASTTNVPIINNNTTSNINTTVTYRFNGDLDGWM